MPVFCLVSYRGVVLSRLPDTQKVLATRVASYAAKRASPVSWSCPNSFSSNTMEEQLKQQLKGTLLQPGDVITLPPHHPQREGQLNSKARKVFEKPAKFGTERFVSLSLLDSCCCVQLCSMLLKE